MIFEDLFDYGFPRWLKATIRDLSNKKYFKDTLFYREKMANLGRFSDEASKEADKEGAIGVLWLFIGILSLVAFGLLIHQVFYIIALFVFVIVFIAGASPH